MKKILLVSALAKKQNLKVWSFKKNKIAKTKPGNKMMPLKELKVVLSCNINTLTPQMHWVVQWCWAKTLGPWPWAHRSLSLFKSIKALSVLSQVLLFVLSEGQWVSGWRCLGAQGGSRALVLPEQRNGAGCPFSQALLQPGRCKAPATATASWALDAKGRQGVG